MKYPGSLSRPKGPEEFIFHATDKKGHHATLSRIAIPPEIDQVMNEIIAKPHFSYRTKADIVRDALYHRLSWLCDNADLGFGDMLRRVKAIDEILEEEEARIDYERQMDKLGAVVAAASDSPERQSELVNSVADEIRRMPEGYWKTRYLTHLKNRFGHLLKPWDMAQRKDEK